jgi:hypothetical protein
MMTMAMSAEEGKIKEISSALMALNSSVELDDEFGSNRVPWVEAIVGSSSGTSEHQEETSQFRNEGHQLTHGEVSGTNGSSRQEIQQAHHLSNGSGKSETPTQELHPIFAAADHKPLDPQNPTATKDLSYLDFFHLEQGNKLTATNAHH